jgi:hypothetical protein
MKISATRIYHGEWMAIDDDTYDGAPDSKSPCGTGPTEQAAIDDLIDKINDREVKMEKGSPHSFTTLPRTDLVDINVVLDALRKNVAYWAEQSADGVPYQAAMQALNDVERLAGLPLTRNIE